MPYRIRNAFGDVVFLAVIAVVAYVVLNVEEEKVCRDEKECLTVHEN